MSVFQNGSSRKLTGGTLDPLPELLLPYEEFPKKIEGPTVWKASDYVNNPAEWTYNWTTEQIKELENAVNEFQASGTSLIDINKNNFKLPNLGKFLGEVKDTLLNGRGFILLKGLPTHRWTIEQSAIAYMGIGSYIGNFVSQNGKGHVLGHVKDIGNDPTRIDKVRIYSTNARQFFHTDHCDVVGLLCLAKAKEGGESAIASSHHVFNVLQQERPDVVRTLTELWYFDRKGEVSKNQKPYVKTPVFLKSLDGRVILQWDPYFVKSLKRFSDIGEIPPLSDKQLEAIEILEKTCVRESLPMTFNVGDIQLLSNHQVTHSRNAYIDEIPPAPKRHLLRLWLSTPVSEGGWKLPYPDSFEEKRGGVQVDDTPEKAPMDAE